MEFFVLAKRTPTEGLLTETSFTKFPPRSLLHCQVVQSGVEALLDLLEAVLDKTPDLEAVLDTTPDLEAVLDTTPHLEAVLDTVFSKTAEYVTRMIRVGRAKVKGRWEEDPSFR